MNGYWKKTKEKQHSNGSIRGQEIYCRSCGVMKTDVQDQTRNEEADWAAGELPGSGEC